MRELQALVTGMIAGALHRAAAEGSIAIDAEVGMDEDGNYSNEILVTGRNSGERLLVTVECIEDGELE